MAVALNCGASDAFRDIVLFERFKKVRRCNGPVIPKGTTYVIPLTPLEELLIVKFDVVLRFCNVTLSVSNMYNVAKVLDENDTFLMW